MALATVRLRDLLIGPRLGRRRDGGGGFQGVNSRVFSCALNGRPGGTDETFALKILFTFQSNGGGGGGAGGASTQEEDLPREVALLRRIPRHGNVITCVHTFRDFVAPDRWSELFYGLDSALISPCTDFVLLPRYQESLQSLIDKQKQRKRGGSPFFRTLDLLWFATDMLAAAAHLHRHGFVHNDIKPDNLLVTRGDRGRETLVLTDFETCLDLNDAVADSVATPATAAAAAAADPRDAEAAAMAVQAAATAAAVAAWAEAPVAGARAAAGTTARAVGGPATAGTPEAAMAAAAAAPAARSCFVRPFDDHFDLGASLFKAPELLRAVRRGGPMDFGKSDAFSCGMCLYLMLCLTGTAPFTSDADMKSGAVDTATMADGGNGGGGGGSCAGSGITWASNDSGGWNDDSFVVFDELRQRDAGYQPLPGPSADDRSGYPQWVCDVVAALLRTAPFERMSAEAALRLARGRAAALQGAVRAAGASVGFGGDDEGSALRQRRESGSGKAGSGGTDGCCGDGGGTGGVAGVRGGVCGGVDGTGGPEELTDLDELVRHDRFTQLRDAFELADRGTIWGILESCDWDVAAASEVLVDSVLPSATVAAAAAPMAAAAASTATAAGW
ncbi:unnamed protein product, partial [Phaeothamnion confervicola]